MVISRDIIKKKLLFLIVVIISRYIDLICRYIEISQQNKITIPNSCDNKSIYRYN